MPYFKGSIKMPKLTKPKSKDDIKKPYSDRRKKNDGGATVDAIGKEPEAEVEIELCEIECDKSKARAGVDPITETVVNVFEPLIAKIIGVEDARHKEHVKALERIAISLERMLECCETETEITQTLSKEEKVERQKI